MAAPVPTQEPAIIYAGDTLLFNRTVLNYPASEGWTLKFVLLATGNNATGQEPITFTNSGTTGDVYNFDVAPTVTDGWQPGFYQFAAYVELNGARYTVATGRFEIKLNLETAGQGDDPRSRNQQILDAIDNLLQGRASADVQMYRIGNRELTKMTPAELIELKEYYEARVRKERIAAGEENVRPRTVGAYFGEII